MNKSYLIAAGMLSVFVALPAVAGPNWQVIHEGEHSHEQLANAPQAEEVLPLDHGPRALSTPWLNKEKRLSILAHEQKKNAALKFAAHHSPAHG